MNKFAKPILTESEVRTAYFVHRKQEISVSAETVVGAEAKNFMDRHGMLLKRGDAEAQAAAKPEHLTHIAGKTLVEKTDPRIYFRGQLDLTEAKLLKCIIQAEKHGYKRLAADFEEALLLLRQVMAADVKNQPLGTWTFLGLDAAALRQQSHHPEQHFGVPHGVPKKEYGFAAVELNLLRAQVRQLELDFLQAFTIAGRVSRPDIAEFLNRFSSGFYIMYCRTLRGDYCEKASSGGADSRTIPVEVSARHVHLCQADLERLFGPGSTLTKQRDLSQGGEFLAEQRVCLRGPKGELQHVAVLGPLRPVTQIELAASDARILGISPPVRLSGNLADAASCTICSGDSHITAAAAIIAQNHIHLAPVEAVALGLTDQQQVDVCVEGARKVIFGNVVVRVAETFHAAMHLDTDEANAAMLENAAQGRIIVK